MPWMKDHTGEYGRDHFKNIKCKMLLCINRRAYIRFFSVRDKKRDLHQDRRQKRRGVSSTRNLPTLSDAKSFTENATSLAREGYMCSPLTCAGRTTSRGSPAPPRLSYHHHHHQHDRCSSPSPSHPHYNPASRQGKSQRPPCS